MSEDLNVTPPGEPTSTTEAVLVTPEEEPIVQEPGPEIDPEEAKLVERAKERHAVLVAAWKANGSPRTHTINGVEHLVVTDNDQVKFVPVAGGMAHYGSVSTARFDRGR
jgi:hypothetical protein